MSAITPNQKSDLRHALIEYLYPRDLLAFKPRQLVRAVAREHLVDFEPDEADVASALKLLVDLGHVKRIDDSLGDDDTYQITAAGVLAHERGEV